MENIEANSENEQNLNDLLFTNKSFIQAVEHLLFALNNLKTIKNDNLHKSENQSDNDIS